MKTSGHSEANRFMPAVRIPSTKKRPHFRDAVLRYCNKSTVGSWRLAVMRGTFDKAFWRERVFDLSSKDEGGI
jgi:hypothetical protein